VKNELMKNSVQLNLKRLIILLVAVCSHCTQRTGLCAGGAIEIRLPEPKLN